MSTDGIIRPLDPPSSFREDRPRALTVKKLALYAFCVIMPLWFKPLTWWLVLSPDGFLRTLGRVALTVNVVVLMALFAGLLILLAWPVLLWFRQTRGWALRYGLLGAGFLPAFWFGDDLGKPIWREGYVQFVVQSAPLIRAIEAYESAHGQPPSTLAELVPDFLPSVPTPRIGGEFRYETGAEAANHAGNPWILRVPIPYRPFLNWDEILYFPRRNYSELGYGSPIERIGSWGYFHE